MPVAPERKPRRASARLAFVAAVVLAACGGPEGVEDPGAPAKTGAAFAATSTITTTTASTSDACVATFAHGAHGFEAGCTLCHACGGAYQFSELTFPRGTSTAGGQIVLGDTRGSATCTVACHGSSPISWSATGPLACTSCHGAVLPSAGVRSAHVAADLDPALDRAGCQGCHDSSGHLSGAVRITVGPNEVVEVTASNPEAVVPACKSCHDGAGNPIAGQTPPLLVGWDSTGSGDWHGARAGTGFGGTLRPGFARGQDELACSLCHSAHASTNDFMFDSTVNGFAIPDGVIDRAGFNGEFLCESCHEGPRHQQCADCHGVDPMPAGSPCFVCHGHEGIQTFPQPWGGGTVSHKDPRWACDHCHGTWMPVVEYTPPAITSLVTVSGITGSSATISWTTDEESTSYVEYGAGGVLGKVAGSSTFSRTHEVTLTGLAEATSYTYRVRTSDRMRNVRVSDVQTFMTVHPDAPPAPEIVPMQDVVHCYTTSATATFQWYPVTTPDGSPVEYRMVADDSTAFDSLVLDSGWITETSWSTPVTLGESVLWYWRVQARNAVKGAVGPWSTVDAFWVGDAQYSGGCY